MNADHLGFPVGIRREIKHLRTWRALGEVVLLVPSNSPHGKTLHIGDAVLAVAIDHIVNGTLVVALEHARIDDILAHKDLLAHLDHLEHTIAAEHDNIVYIRTLADIFVFLQSCPHKAFGTVHVQLLVGGRHHIGLDVLEIADFSPPFPPCPVFLLDILEIGNRIIHQMFQIAANRFHFLLHRLYLLVGFLDIELGNLADRLFDQLQHILLAHFPPKTFLERLESLFHRLDLLFPTPGILFHQTVNPFLEKNLLQRSPIPFLLQLAHPHIQFRMQQIHRIPGGNPKHFRNTQELGLLGIDHAGIGGNGHLAIGKSVQGIQCGIGRYTGLQIDQDIGLLRGVILYFPDLYLPFLAGLQDALNDRCRRGPVRDLHYLKGLLVQLLDSGPDTDFAATQTIVVIGHVDAAPCREIGIKLEILAREHFDRSIDQFIEIMRQNLACQTDRNPFHPLRQQQRELDRQGYRLLVPPIIRRLPSRGLGVENDLQRKGRQPGFDVTRGCRRVPGQDIAPVPLAVNQQVFLPELHQGIADRSISVGMVLHRVAHDIGYLVIAAVFQFLHGMQDPPLHRLQAVRKLRHGTSQNHIGSIIQVPILEQSRNRNDASGFVFFFYFHLLSENQRNAGFRKATASANAKTNAKIRKTFHNSFPLSIRAMLSPMPAFSGRRRQILSSP